MEKFGIDFDIVKNISVIEKLKCDLLSGTSDLFSGMTVSGTTISERKELLAEIIISAYLLSSRLGIDLSEIDRTILNKLKTGLLEQSPLSKDKSLLYKFIDKE